MECLGYGCDTVDVGGVALGTAWGELELVDYVPVRCKSLFVFAGGKVDTFGESGGAFGDGSGLPARGSGLFYALTIAFLGDTLLDTLFIGTFSVLSGGGPIAARVFDAFFVLGLCGGGAAGPFTGCPGC